MSSPIVVGPSATSQWQQLVDDAQQLADIRLSEDLESYLVFLLMRHVGNPHVASRILAIDYLEGMSSAGHLRNERLRDVGDQCLLYSGLFPRRAARRRVRVSYFVDLGRSAYDHLAHRLERGMAELYGGLAEGFVQLLDTLHAMRRMGTEPAGLDALSAAELWQDAGSREAYRELKRVSSGEPVRIGDGGRRH